MPDLEEGWSGQGQREQERGRRAQTKGRKGRKKNQDKHKRLQRFLIPPPLHPFRSVQRVVVGELPVRILPSCPRGAGHSPGSAALSGRCCPSPAVPELPGPGPAAAGGSRRLLASPQLNPGNGAAPGSSARERAAPRVPSPLAAEQRCIRAGGWLSEKKNKA